MRLQDIMNRKIETIAADAEADEANERMRQQHVHHLVVVEEGRPVGIISERDLGGKNRSLMQNGSTVADLMTSDFVSAKPTTTIKEAANLLRGHQIGSLLVMDKNKLAGIITITDLLELLGRGLQKPVAVTERAILSRRHGKQRVVMR